MEKEDKKTETGMDVEAKKEDPLPETDANEKEKEKVVPYKNLIQSLTSALRNVLLGVKEKTNLPIGRSLRVFASHRKEVTATALRVLLTLVGYADSKLMSIVPAEEEEEIMEGIVENLQKLRVRIPSYATTEVKVFLFVQVLVFLIDNAQPDLALDCASELMSIIQKENRRMSFLISSKGFFYYSLCHETFLPTQFGEIRDTLLSCLRTATLQHDANGQAILINLLLRNFLHFNMYEQAERFLAKVHFPESIGGNQATRFAYYVGRIKLILLDYSSAHAHLTQALRKAPTKVAGGFRSAVTKLLVISKLLMGQIPEKSLFHENSDVIPYYELTKAVRVGDLETYGEVMRKYAECFRVDKTRLLVARLRHTVIKVCLRNLNMSYSRISLAEITSRLHLEDVRDTESIVAKAIRDGVIEAEIDHENGFVVSRDHLDVYSTDEPALAFHDRIEFCMRLHNQAVRGMRFPDQTTVHVEEPDMVITDEEIDRALDEEED
eukprot:TRINITY_DN2537_c0_g1_i1.p1 TRINITY_DN2537_c0_g1~~TRINITY_DN2537_c0_g1_i1.p1  ORF type:complete len:494 (-),score=140.54 TRINITY_DN2537_c0_g1_i1:162-1643(-)